jgi:2-oxoglutarate ferredoxin oxidoreductase subunit alpha
LESTTVQNTLIDASKIITESLVRSGADVFIGYPITPSNLFYSYGQRRYPSFYAAPDEITVLQWMAGFSSTGKLPVTATAFPGLALMVESLNMAFMMELPMVLVIVQRMGPSTGSATTGAQGDLAILNGIISGGYTLPVFCPSNFEDAWDLSHKAVKTAVELRTPVILLTSKEMVMTNKSFDLSKLGEVKHVDRSTKAYKGDYKPYLMTEDKVPPFVPVGDLDRQVRINASTHDQDGAIKKTNPDSMANTHRLKEKIDLNVDELCEYDLDTENGAEKLIVTWGISTDAARDAVNTYRKNGNKVALLTVKTLLPISTTIYSILDSYKELLFVEENISGQLKEIIFGKRPNKMVKQVNKIGSMISPDEILKELI